MQEVFLLQDQNSPQTHASGFVKYATREEALAAIDAVHGKIHDKDCVDTLKVRFAHSQQQKQMRTQLTHHAVAMMRMQGQGIMGVPMPFPHTQVAALQGYSQQGMMMGGGLGHLQGGGGQGGGASVPVPGLEWVCCHFGRDALK